MTQSITTISNKGAVDLDLFVSVWNQTQGMKTPRVHLKILSWLQVQWRLGRRRLLLMAFRSCGKSTLVGLFAAWLLYQNPNMRILVLAAETSLAAKMVRNVKRILERHPLTRHLKPDNADQWASARFTVNREGELRDPSMIARGVSANITGSRADIVICDDVEVPNTSETFQKRQELRERLSEVQFILGPEGRQLYIGTPHCFDTIYQTGEDGFLKGFCDYRVPLCDQDGHSAWPERFSAQDIQRMERSSGPNRFAAQMMLRPVSMNEARLSSDHLQPYTGQLSYQEARGRPYITLNDRRLVSCAAWWDPAFGAARGDRSVLAIIYMCDRGEYWLHHIGIIRTDPGSDLDEATQQCRQVIALLEQFYVPAIHLEINGIGRFLPAILRRELKGAAWRCSVIEVHNHRPKDTRILEGFDAVLAAQALHIQRDVMQGPFLGEMQEWRPGCSQAHDDCLDAVACALLTQPIRIGAQVTDHKITH